MTDTTASLDIEAISERYFDRWEARDPDGIAELHTDDTQFWSHAGGGPVTGRAAVRAAFAEIFERFPGFSFETYRVLRGEDFWVLDWALLFTPEGGEQQRFDCLDVVNVSPQGLVSRKDTFIDMVQLQAALPQLDVEAEMADSEIAS